MEDGDSMADVKFETIKAEVTKVGANNFVEVARKKAISEKGETEFVAISRGFITPDGTKRYTKSITVPAEAVDFVSDKLKEMK